MPEAYADAAQRHWADATLLESEKRIPNADQLYGIAAECAIKAALVVAFAASGRLAPRYFEHVNLLWDVVPVQGLQKRFPGLVALLKAGNMFSDWEVAQRYESDAAVPEPAMVRHRDAARRILGAAALLGSRRGS